MSNRNVWIIAGAIVLAAALIVGVLLYLNAEENRQRHEDRCDEIRGSLDLGDLVEYSEDC